MAERQAEESAQLLTPEYVKRLLEPNEEDKAAVSQALLVYNLAKQGKSLKVGDRTFEYSDENLVNFTVETIVKTIKKYRDAAYTFKKRFFGLLGKKKVVVDPYKAMVAEALERMYGEIRSKVSSAYETVRANIQKAADKVGEGLGKWEQLGSELYSV